MFFDFAVGAMLGDLLQCVSVILVPRIPQDPTEPGHGVDMVLVIAIASMAPE